MHLKKYIVIILVQLLLPLEAAEPSHSATDNAPSVIWARTDFAPYFILNGNYQNQGISDQIILYFSKHIDGIRHRSAEMSLKRMLKNAQSGEALCHVALLKTPERATFLDFSLPIMQSYSNGIITSAQGLQKLGMTPETIRPVNLSRVLKKNINISVHDGRSYSPYIDQIIKQEREKPHSVFQIKLGLKEHERLLRMIMNNRLDGLISRPEEMQVIIVEQKLQEALYFVEIIDDTGTDISYVGCSKGAWNKTLLTKINQLIENDPNLSETIHTAHKQWLPDHLHHEHVLKQE